VKNETPSHGPDCGCHDCRGIARNRFFRGKSMKAEEFTLEQRYGIERRRLLNRSVAGWGVVYGFAMSCCENEHEKPHPIAVGDGFALDRHGREVVLCDKRTLDRTDTFLVREHGTDWAAVSIDAVDPGVYVLSVHYAERQYGDAKIPEGCGCPKPEKNFTCETAVFSLRRCDECPCAEARCDRRCRCGTCGRCPAAGRGPHACLCQWIEETSPPSCGPLRAWNGFDVDPADGIPIACVRLEVNPDRCSTSIVGIVTDDCGPRRLVKNNDLLYDLLRGCDLTHIAQVSWHAWHRSPAAVKWSDFAAQFHPDGTTDFSVVFSGPVLVETIHPDVVTMTAITLEQATGWRVLHRVPIRALDPSTGSNVPPGTTDRMRVVVPKRWFDDEIARLEESWLTERSFHVEIEIRGDYILDCHHQAVDANAVGLRAAPTGNGTPGGIYLSNFHVEAKPSVEAPEDIA
jgi:hypothetical protein